MTDRLLLVDNRNGSEDLLGPLQRRGIPAELARLEFADFAFIGRGLDDADVTIGIELKRTIERRDDPRSDLIASMYSDRFSGHQLPGLVRTYDRPWLITEGIWREGKEGELEILHKRDDWRPARLGRKVILYRDLEAWLLTQRIRGGVEYEHCSKRADTIRFLASLFHWWTSKALNEHRSHKVIYRVPPDRASFVEPSAFVKMASCLPGVGAEKADTLEDRHFRFQLLKASGEAASVADLCEVEGFGKTLATKVLTTLTPQPSGGIQ